MSAHVSLTRLAGEKISERHANAPRAYHFASGLLPAGLRDIERMLVHADGAKSLAVWIAAAMIANATMPRGWLLEGWRDTLVSTTKFAPSVIDCALERLVDLGVIEPSRRLPTTLLHVAAFVRVRCECASGNWCESAALRTAYLTWCRETVESVLSATELNAALADLGYEYTRSRFVEGRQRRCWTGLQLRK